jgi:hypothetical protein
MGKTFSTGLLTNGIWQDASNNIGIGGSPSGSYKFEVTGTGRFSSNVQLGAINSTGVGSATPITLGLGSTFGTNPIGTNFKLKLFEDSSPSIYGFGVSSGLLEIISPSTSSIGFFTNGANERMRITSAGNVCIGTSTSSGYGNVNLDLNAGTLPAAYFVLKTSSNSVIAEYALDSGAAYLSTKTTHPIIFRTSDVERMRIATNGKILINRTTSTSDTPGEKQIEINGNIFSRGSLAGYFFDDRVNASYWYGWYATGNTVVYFFNGFTQSNIGTINPSTGAYTALSDINKKKDFEESTIGLNAILGLKPTLYRMKTDKESEPKQLGFIAQQVKEFIPQAYVESEDFIGLNDKPIVAALVKAVQELSAKVSALENKS